MSNANPSPWLAAPPARPAAEAWQATRAQTALATQIVGYEEAIRTEQPDIGRPVSDDERELFVSCDPAQALQQQFEHLRPTFIAVHDIGTTSSRKLVAGVAAAGQRPLQRLVIRRQGSGTALATIEFAELPGSSAQAPLRLFTTQADADTAARHGVAHMLLAYSRLGVVMVGALPQHALEAALKPLQEQMLAGPWPGRQLLLLPLANASALANLGNALARGTGVTVRTTPAVTRPADAWNFISGTWSRIGVPPPPPASARAAAAPAEGAPLALRPMPQAQVPAATAHAPAEADSLLQRHVREVARLPGLLACCIFSVDERRPLAHAGAAPGAAELARHGATLLAAMGDTGRALRLDRGAPRDAAISFDTHHLILRALPGHPGLALHAVLARDADLLLARTQIARLDERLQAPGAAAG